jgi:hypothetical protein
MVADLDPDLKSGLGLNPAGRMVDGMGPLTRSPAGGQR